MSSNNLIEPESQINEIDYEEPKVDGVRYFNKDYDHLFQENQLHRELLNVLGLSPFDGNNSASRKQMFASHIGQSLVINGATRRRIQTGMEREYGKYTFSVKMPVDADIIRILERYPRTIGGLSPKQNPETLIIYENSDTKEIGCLNLTEYFTYHPYFGFKYKPTPALKKLRVGASIKAGTILLDSPSVVYSDNDNCSSKESRDYCYGAEMNVAFMSHPSVSEDGILVSRDVLKKFSFKTYETRVVEWGSKRFPLNLYGTKDNYKPHPEIGDPIRPDGLLMALRSYDEAFAPSEQSRINTMTVDNIFDKMVYAGGPGGKVVDIRVMHDTESALPLTPVGMEVQTNRYDEARKRYFQAIYEEYERLLKDRGNRLQLSLEFHRLVVESISVIGNQKPRGDSDTVERVTKLHRAAPLDDWRVEFVIEYETIPDVGFKLTDTHGF